MYNIQTTEIDDCDATTGWAGTDCTVATESTIKKEGTNSLKITKTTVAASTCYAEKSVTPSLVSSHYLRVYSYPSAATVTQVTLRLYQGAAYNDYYLAPTAAIWNLSNKLLSSPDATSGGGITDFTAITKVRVIITTNANADVPSVYIDYILTASPDQILLGDTYIDAPDDYQEPKKDIEVKNTTVNGTTRRHIMARKKTHTLGYTDISLADFLLLEAERDKDTTLRFIWPGISIDTTVHMKMEARKFQPGTIYLSDTQIELTEEL